MRKIYISLFAMIFAGGTVYAQQSGIAFFEGTIDEACAKAREEGKRVFIDFYTDWCKPCMAIAHYLFPDEEAGKYFNANFINMKIDAEKGTGPEAADKFEVAGFPTFLILDSSGETLARWMGGSYHPTPKDFIARLEKQLELGPDGDPQEAMLRKMWVEQEASEKKAGPVEKPAYRGMHEFDGSFADALAKAKTEGKMVFVDCYTQWCGPCKLMAERIFPLKEVGDFINPRFVFLKLDMENGEGTEFKKKHKIEGYPTFIVFSNDGEELSRFMGGILDPAAFITKIIGIIDQDRNPEALLSRYDGGDRDKAFMRNYIDMLFAEGRAKKIHGALTELMSSLTEEEKFLPEYWKYWTSYGIYAPVGSDNFTFLVRNRHKFGVGNKVVTDWLVDIVNNKYQIIIRDGHNPEQLIEADGLAKSLELERNTTVLLYRGLAEATLQQDSEMAIEVLNKYADSVLYPEDKDFLIFTIISSFRDTLTKEQRDQLMLMVTNERLKQSR